ncbi:MAG: alpha-L-fucosidase [Bacteroidales bacterium]|nr:alpha-L-fucosidase [Bacteroidales bacterium]
MSKVYLLLFLCISLLSNAQDITKEQRMQWFEDAKLGIFIHWGIYSVNGTSESWAFYNGHVSHTDYMKQIEGFTAEKWSPVNWATLIKESGAQYTVITTKHHDGVALWGTKFGNSNMLHNSPAKRDLITPFSKAIREQGLKLGVYYSLIDWSYPDYPNFTRKQKRYENDSSRFAKFTKYNLGQIKELGKFKPDLYWFDGDWEQSAERWKAIEIREMILESNPNAIINSRLRGYGDYATPEQGVPIHKPNGRYWELCLTMNDSWGYYPTDTSYKSVNQVIRIFVDVISKGGNLLLDIGPKADGTIPEEQVAILKGLGRWTKKHKEAIYGSRAGLPADYFNGYSAISKDSTTLYLYLDNQPTGEVLVKGLLNKVKRAYVVGSAKEISTQVLGKLSWSKAPGLLYINLPENLQDQDVTVIALELEGTVKLYNQISGVQTDSD